MIVTQKILSMLIKLQTRKEKNCQKSEGNTFLFAKKIYGGLGCKAETKTKMFSSVYHHMYMRETQTRCHVNE